jgi:MFS transporter, DHA2 family, multidrug resistance protein
MSPAGFFAVLAMPVVSRLLGRQTDARWLIGAGLLLLAVSNYWMSRMNLDISPDQVIWPRAGLVVGLAIVFYARERGCLSLRSSLFAWGGRGLIESSA